MVSMKSGSKITSENVELLLLGFGLANSFRVLSLEEVSRAMPKLTKESVRQALDHLADDDLVTRFAGRYCFNKEIPSQKRRSIEQLTATSNYGRRTRGSRPR